MAQTRHVVITGASTGIGRASALMLASRGWHVFAGVRKEKDGDALLAAAGDNVTPISLDVTQPEQIRAAVEEVQEHVGESGLHGLVNNAGIVVAGPLEFLPLDEVRRQFEVNVFGTIAATQAFLPLIRAQRGRIVIVGSTSGFWCEPFVAPYGASKFALEAIADSLRVELRPWGIQVPLVEPGAIATPIWEKSEAAAEGLLKTLPPECATLYAQPMKALPEAIKKIPKLAIDPNHVARSVTRALESRKPRTRYLVGLDARAQSALRHILSDRLRDRLTSMVMNV